MRVGIDMISADSGLAPAVGGMAAYYEGLLGATCIHPKVTSVVAFVPPWGDGLGLPHAEGIEVVPCFGLSRQRPLGILYEQTLLPSTALRHRVDVLLSTCNVKPMAWRRPSVVVLQSMQHLLLPVKTPPVRRAYLKLALNRSMHTADVVIAVSEASRADAIRVFSLDPSRIVAVHHGVAPWVADTLAKGCRAEPYRLPGGEPYVLTISRLHDLKNHLRLIEAMAQVVREREVPHKLVIAGGDADYRCSDLEAIARQHGIQDRVVCLGAVPQEQVPALFAGADAVAYVSLYETFGLPVLEALAFGAPLVASDAGATREIADRAARLVHPTDVRSIAAGLGDVLRDEALRARLRAEGPARVKEFTWKRCAEGTVTALEQAIDLNRANREPDNERLRRLRSARDQVDGFKRDGRRQLEKQGLHKVFEFGQRAGFDVLPRHFYSEVPSIDELRTSVAWREPRDMTAILGSDLAFQVSFMRGCCSPDVVKKLPSRLFEDACVANGAVGFGPIEAEFLYCFIATKRPRRVIQIGCGVSSEVILRACRVFEHQVALTCVEPFPTGFLAERAASGEIELIRAPAQTVDLGRFTALRAGDLLFVDSTHTVKPGSEVNRIVLDVLPHLEAGVYVHFHDVVFPYDYSPEILRSDLFFWSESVFLQAFLTQNSRCALRASLSMIHHAQPECLQELLRGYRPAHFEQGLMLDTPGSAHFPSSAYLETLAS